MSKRIIIGNWKMNPLSLKEAEKLFKDTAKQITNSKKSEIVICPPFIYLEKLKRQSKKISLGAQDIFWENGGAYTGEISGQMLYDLGIKYVIIGHSERRSIGESNQDINKKIKAALGSGLVPILCIGEKKRDPEHEYLNFIKNQAEECLSGISKNLISKVVIAYEPVWAIGEGANAASPEEFREMNIFIKKILADKFGAKNISDVKIIYGGSVDDKNAVDFIKEGQADGFLPGRASLNPEKFSKIVKICEELKK